MLIITNYLGKRIRFTDERIEHILGNPPEMNNQMGNIEETLRYPDTVVRSVTDYEVQLYYKYFNKTPVTRNTFASS